ncbi:tRNA methyltransferase 10 [Boothiomyces sp. JEL0866]|nr:tRNA methyltransferase 10 [Boothiomyces sp. JEL0866]
MSESGIAQNIPSNEPTRVAGAGNIDEIQSATVISPNTDGDAPKVSKRQMKKQKKQEKYLEKKEYMRSKRKEERKAKREQRVEAGLPPRPKKRKIEQESSGVRVIIDLSFEKYMMEKVLDIGQHEKHFMELSKEELQQDDQEPLQFCYLTADSPNVITDLDPKTIYVVGGIVDKNRHKGLCFQEAEKYKIGHARLPIGEFIKLGTRKVLTINHVVAILGEYVNQKNWKEAFLKVLPARKGAQAKETGDAEEANQVEENEDSENSQDY